MFVGKFIDIKYKQLIKESGKLREPTTVVSRSATNTFGIKVYQTKIDVKRDIATGVQMYNVSALNDIATPSAQDSLLFHNNTSTYTPPSSQPSFGNMNQNFGPPSSQPSFGNMNQNFGPPKQQTHPQNFQQQVQNFQQQAQPSSTFKTHFQSSNVSGIGNNPMSTGAPQNVSNSYLNQTTY